MTRPWPTTIDYSPWVLPLRRPVIVAASTEPLHERRGVLVRVTSTDPDRPVAMYGDACPLPGLSHDGYDDVVANFMKPFVPQRRPASLDWALYAAHCWSAVPCPTKTALLLDDDLDALHAIADGATVKLKVGRRPLVDDLARVAAVTDVVRAKHGRLRLDGNRRLEVDAAVAIAAVAKDVLEFFEEPTIVSKLKQLPSAFPLALDEWFDELRVRGGVAKLPRARAWVIKPTVLGADVTLEIVRAAAGAKIAVIVSSAYESSVGRQALACFARYIDTMLRRNKNDGDIDGGVVHGLGTGPAFERDLDLTALDTLSWTRWT